MFREIRLKYLHDTTRRVGPVCIFCTPIDSGAVCRWPTKEGTIPPTVILKALHEDDTRQHRINMQVNPKRSCIVVFSARVGVKKILPFAREVCYCAQSDFSVHVPQHIIHEQYRTRNPRRRDGTLYLVRVVLLTMHCRLKVGGRRGRKATSLLFVSSLGSFAAIYPKLPAVFGTWSGYRSHRDGIYLHVIAVEPSDIIVAAGLGTVVRINKTALKLVIGQITARYTHRVARLQVK